MINTKREHCENTLVLRARHFRAAEKNLIAAKRAMDEAARAHHDAAKKLSESVDIAERFLPALEVPK